MPFVRGGELYKILMQEKRFPEPIVKFYIAQIVMAIGHLHSKGIMHRDLKLENVLVSESGYLKIIDYGLAKLSSDTSLAQTYCGTPEYLAPEMIQGTGHDQTVDWWAVGILTYELMIGGTPFYHKNRQIL